MVTLDKAECELLIKKLEYTFKKKATVELDSKEVVECSAGAQILHKLREGSK